VLDSMGRVHLRRRGFGRFMASANGVTDSAWIHGTQVVQSITVDRDTLRFHSLGQGQQLTARLIDENGLTVADSLPSITPRDSAVVAIQSAAALTIQSRENGVTAV